MKIEIAEEDRQFLQKALNYVVLSLDNYTIDNSKLPSTQKMQVIANCYYLLQMLINATDDEQKKMFDSKDDTILKLGEQGE